MTHALRSLLLGAAWMVGAPALAADGAELQRIALVIGSNDGGEDRVRLRYADTDAGGFAGVLTELGGVDPFDVLLVSDPTRNEIEAALDIVGARAAAGRAAGRRVEVILYYSGHSNTSGLLPRGELLPYSTLRARLAMLEADIKVSVLDSCSSGALIRTKGGVRRPPFLLDQSNVVNGEAYLTSSTADESSQESDIIGASYFTHHLVTGLRGVADADQDGLVTLREAYAYTFRKTRESTENSIAGPQSPYYALDLVGQGELVMTDLRAATSLLVLADKLDGEIWIRDESGRLLAQVDKIVGNELTLFVPPGSYTIAIQTRPEQFVARVEVEDGEPTLISSALFTPNARLDTGRARGDGPVTVVQPMGSGSAPRRVPEPSSIEPFSFQLVHGVGSIAPTARVEGLAWDFFQGTHHSLKGLELAAVAGVIHHDVEGAQLSGLVNVARGELRGLQVSLLSNVAVGQDSGFQLTGGVNVAGDLGPDAGIGGQFGFVGNVDMGSRQGAQIAGVFNATGRHLRGVQLSGIVNVSSGEVAGVQLTGGVNIATGRMRGLQGSLLFNTAADFRGAQLGLINNAADGTGAQFGIINVAKNLKGFQLGLINVARHLDGDAVGLITAARNGYHAWELWSDDVSNLSMGFKFGGKRIYSVVTIGHDVFSGGLATLGFGLGGHTQLGKVGYFDLDLLVRSDERLLNQTIGDDPSLSLTLRPTFGLRLGKRFGLLLGPDLSTSVGLGGDGAHDPSLMPSWSVSSNARMWVGYRAGISIAF